MKEKRIFRLMAKNLRKCLDVPKRFPIFATSNLTSGTRTAGITSSLFCVPTYRILGVATPCPEPGNRPGVSASKNLTARSVVILLSNLTSYGNKELSSNRERHAALLLLPPAGIEPLPPHHGSLRGGTGRQTHPNLRAQGMPDAPGLRQQRRHHQAVGGRHEQPAREQRSVPGDDVVARPSLRVRLHPHRAHPCATPVTPASCHRLSWSSGFQVTPKTLSL